MTEEILQINKDILNRLNIKKIKIIHETKLKELLNKEESNRTLQDWNNIVNCKNMLYDCEETKIKWYKKQYSAII